MSSDSNINMKNIEKLLGNLPDNVMDIFSSLIKPDESKALDSKPKEDLGGLEMIMTVKKLMDKFNNNDDCRVDLIRALKPFLKPSRQEKVLQCVKALKISHLCKEASFLTTGPRNKEDSGD